ncbi:DNA repair protein RadC [Methanoregula sp.]|uniref:RadC family protein n=1 Tax=Methanoregula sp. TaxID=2052170 RepID=UPI0035642BFB
MKKMKDVPKHDRPREKIAIKGVAALTDTELIEAILGRGVINRDVRTIARDIAAMFCDHTREIRYEDVLAIGGIGPTKAAQIMACLELGRRRYEPTGAITIKKPEDILPLVGTYREKPQEYFICISLTGAGEVISNRVVTIGILNHSLVHPREVFVGAITDRAASVICVHNHPSGSLEASAQDIAVTRQLQEAGVLLGIQLLDHIIITKTGFSSMKEKGLV